MNSLQVIENTQGPGAVPVSDCPPQFCRAVQRLPLVMYWNDGERPLPTRVIRSTTSRRPLPCLLNGTPWFATRGGERFDFCGHMHRLCRDIAERCGELRHIDARRLLFAVTQARNSHRHGLQARVTPLRFAGGKLTLLRRGFVYQVQRFLHGENEFLYLVTFCLPRYLDQDFDSKLITLFHELFHISPAFDGDLRRHQGRYCLHTHSQRDYDAQMAKMARAYLQDNPDPTLFDFLRLNFAQLQQRHGDVLGVVVPRPKIIPIGTVCKRHEAG